MFNTLRSWHRGRSFLPVEGFAFGRPLLLLQSDDWGRVGIRDQEGWEELRESGVDLGARSYDFYSLETAEDVSAIVSLLQRHRDSEGRPACLGMNFILANVDFAKVRASNFRQIYLRTLAEGLPDRWKRPGLFEAYREGISAGILSPALHGTTHFCRPAVERRLGDPGERGMLLRRLWNVGVPYIHWRMPWVGFEYWDSERSGQEAFLSFGIQESLIDFAVKSFADFFSESPRSACAPGYRANDSTHRAWAKHGIRVAQNGPGSAMPPYFDENGILQLYRSLDFEPAAGQGSSVDAWVRVAEDCFTRGVPAIVSLHSINFHSTIKDFRSRTLALLDEFLTALETRHTDLLYGRDEDVYDLVDKGALRSTQSAVRVPVTKRKFATRAAAAGWRT
ncbi:MAG: hypothetical protein WB660_01380 [Candidatus Sulfotelmatobacter sp.]